MYCLCETCNCYFAQSCYETCSCEDCKCKQLIVIKSRKTIKRKVQKKSLVLGFILIGLIFFNLFLGSLIISDTIIVRKEVAETKAYYTIMVNEFSPCFDNRSESLNVPYYFYNDIDLPVKICNLQNDTRYLIEFMDESQDFWFVNIDNNDQWLPIVYFDTNYLGGLGPFTQNEQLWVYLIDANTSTVIVSDSTIYIELPFEGINEGD